MLPKKLDTRYAPLPPAPHARNIALAWLGGGLAVAVLSNLGNWLHVSLILGSFGASCVLVFGFPEVPFSQPHNVVAGHFLSALVGLLFLELLGSHGWSL